jgi:glycosyltransferase involved in cell wall biosynthesis
MDLIARLLARGHQVHLLYSDLRSDRLFTENLRILRNYSGFRALPVAMCQWPGRSDLRAIRVLRQYVRSHEPFDLVHCHSTKAGLIGRLGLLGLSVKRVYTPHGFVTTDPTQALFLRRAASALEAALSRCCDWLIIVSRKEQEHALDIGIPASKLRLIPNGVALDEPRLSPIARAALRAEWGVDNTDVCVGFVGRLTAVKSPETTLRSFAALLGRRPSAPARLIMVGEGPLEGSLRRLSAELNINGHVTWLGACEARPLMGAFDMLALTSESEGHPLVVLEAMARGLPIVATSVGGIPDTVQHGVNGFITPVRGVQEIATALETLVNDPELRRRMGQASLAISRNFSVDRMVDQTVALYEQVISGSQTPTASPDLKVAALR